MQYITSNQNNLVKLVASYKDGKEGFALVEGTKIIKEVAKYGTYCNMLFVEEQVYNELKDYIDPKCEVYIVTPNILEKLSYTKTNQGVVGVVKCDKKSLKAPEGNFLVLDNLQDPGNFGTICRSSLGADFRDIYVINCPNYLSSKMVRSSMGTVFGLNIYETSYDELNKLIVDNKLTLLVADLDGENIFDYNPPEKFGIAIGNEGNGISKELLSIPNKKITIPMKNNLESLNAGVSSAICMYCLSNKRR